MKKKGILIISLFVFIGLFNLVNFAKGFYCNLIFLETDKEIYYNDESIKINASWELEYNNSAEISFIQIQIYDFFNNIQWNSSKYYESGKNYDSWTINIQDLDLTFMNYSNILYVKFFYYNYEIASGVELSEFLKIIEIKTIKRNVSCELIDFTNHIRHGENICFKARFYNTSLNNNSNLINYLISFKVISNEIILYKNNYTTNSSGIIEIFISSLTNLTVGLNYLIFTISGNEIYNDSNFEFKLFVELLTLQESNSKKSNKKNDNSLHTTVISFISIISLSFMILFLIYYNNTKRTKQHDLTEITFKY